MMNPGLVLGYHGCSSKVAEKIFSGELLHLNPSDSSSEWLGKGVYFWENSYDRALEWAKSHLKKQEEPAVVGAIIIPGMCMDLTDAYYLDALHQFVPLFELEWQLEYGCLPENKGLYHTYDCALINRYHLYLAKSRDLMVDTIRAAFPEGARIGSSSFSKRNHIQWSVLNPKESIVGYFRPIIIDE